MLTVLIFALQLRPVQTYIAKKAANYLSKELNTEITLTGLFVKPFKSVVLENLYVEDLQKDTLLYAPQFTIDLNSLSLRNRKISVNVIQLDNGKFHLKEFKDTTTNLDFIINYFDTGKPKPKVKPTKKPYEITFDNITLNNFSFKYKNYRVDTAINGINFDDVLLNNLNARLSGLDTKDHLLKTKINHLSFKEKSGFVLNSLKAETTIDTNKMEFKSLEIITPNSKLTDYVSLSYKKFKDFSSFIRKVKVQSHLTNSRIHPRDISFFAPIVQKIKLPVIIDGDLSGYVNNIKARNFSVRAGQATYLKGNFNIKGLPKLSETFLDLDFDQIASNKKDADQIIYALTGLKGQIPIEAQKFGNVNFKGKFTGFPKDFIAYGEFKTQLGRFSSDVNMKILDAPVYSGTIKAYDFNLGELLNEKTLGRTTATATINGRGFNKSSLKERLSGSIVYLDFQGYRYRNIKLDGTFNKNLFAGKVNVNDPNLFLDFNGNIDLNPNLPQFNFVATVRNANLNRLKLSKDTVRIDASFSTNFTGNNLDNIQGNLQLRRIRLTNPANSLVVDSVSLFAEGLGGNRSLSINSDILDASIKGEYDLNTLPSYFKSVVKRYIPSLNTTIVKPAPQNFEFNMQLKQFDPITLLYLPDIKIPEGASINGRFISSKNIATMNMFAKLIEYKGIKINNLILDQATIETALNIFIASDRVDITDSLYIKNVNIANILRNDSLNLNVKLSDKDATNQLDLNGLVYFNKDSAALFSILPSDVIINNESWRVQEEVRIGLEKNKTTITDFALSRGNQVVTINGAISSDPEDILNLNFKQFLLSTLNPLAKAAGITVKGELNGDVSIGDISKNPRIESALIIDSLNLNNTDIGRMDLKAGFDNETKLINVITNITRGEVETLNLEGTYNASVADNSLDMSVKMDNSPLVVVQPFIKQLVTNLTGTASADLRLTGTIFSPRIDGSLSLNDAGFVVNYLKTPYRITDDLVVENSVIILDKLVIKDVKNHEAIANGTVDMSNPNNPTINAVIDARNFMALNTTAKDNPLYYGVAFGTGRFSFTGPTDNMRINIDAKTEAGTIFNIPLNSSETISDNEFITFTPKDSTAGTPKKINVFEGLVMNFNLAVDRNSVVNIITDMGRLSGRGETESLNLKITSMGDFEMYGTYNIADGKFEFTAQEYINKVFEISQGGTIRWSGDPTEATIDLKAVYEVRTSLRPLYTAAGRPPTDQRVLAQAVMNLSKSLLQPEISFDLNFPTDAYVKDELQAFFSDVNNKNQQALSLIVRRSFSPNTGLNLGTVNSTITSAGTELVFNQLNNLIAQSLNLPSVDLNIRSFNEASASVRLLNERLVFTYGITDRRTEIYDYNFFGGSSIARDVEAQLLLKRDGSLMLRASNRLNNRSFLDQLNNTEYVSALGLVYRQEFDNLNELVRILIGQKRREERRNQPKPASDPKTIALKPEEIEVPKK